MDKKILKLIEKHKTTLIERVIQLLAAVVTLILSSPIFGVPELPLSIKISFFIVSVTIISFIIYSRFFMPRIPIYPVRFDFMENELPRFIKKADSVKILNIAFTRFKNLKALIKDKICEDDTKFEILLAKRKREKDDISYLILRENDEGNWKKLRIDLNLTLFELFIFMLEDLYHDKKIDNINVIEYPFYPVMCMYNFDDKDLIFGPYISKRCEDIPMFHLKNRIYKKEISKAYEVMDAHHSILNNSQNLRPDKEYVENFCYFDGNKNISIKEFINQYHKKLSEYLDTTRKAKYEQYLIGYNSNFHDRYIEDLGKEEELEGRFDAVMRNIATEIQKQG